MNKQEIVSGALAGFVGTVPMTIAMEGLHNILPPQQKYPLPPEQITHALEKRTGINLPQPLHMALTWAGHFGYGTAIGTIYALTAEKLPFPSALNGALFGLAVWGASYIGWLPGVGIMPPASRQPKHRNALMIAAHLVWGMVTALLVDELEHSSEPPSQFVN